jgi:CPA1 family monovalent cation:H+ antiporter
MNGFVFVLIGLQLPFVLAGVSELSGFKVILYGVLFSVFLILLRLVWSFPGAYVSYLIRTRILHQHEKAPDLRQVFVVGWTGMRGVIALAAAISLPETLGDGSPFPHRDLIIFLTFSVILVTLVLQGLTLPPLIRLLGLAKIAGPKEEDREARRLVIEAALARLEEIRHHNPTAFTDAHDDLARHYEHRLASMGGQASDPHGTLTGSYSRYLDLSREFLAVERQIALKLRDEGQISDELLGDLEHELDLNETRLIAAAE